MPFENSMNIKDLPVYDGFFLRKLYFNGLKLGISRTANRYNNLYDNKYPE
jgi:hypothetical protein